MTGAQQRISIFGNFGGGNLGNEGTLEAMIAFLRQVRPDSALVCLCHSPEVVTSRYGIAALPYRVPRSPGASPLRKLKARLADVSMAFRGPRGTDVLIVPGTGVLDDFGERPLGMPLTIFLTCLAARLQRVKIYFVSIGAGPIEHPMSRWLMKSAAALAHYRSYRDVPSKQFMKKLGLDVQFDEIYPDLAFKLSAPPCYQSESPKQPLTIGVGMMTYRGWRTDPARGQSVYDGYLEKMTTFVLWLLDNGYNVRVLTGEDSDESAVSDLSRNITHQRERLASSQFVAELAGSLHELMAQIAQTDIVIATRFHNAVYALKLGRPVASIGYSEKFNALLNEMGLEEFCQHTETFDVEVLKTQVTKLIANRQTHEQRIRQTMLGFEERLRHQDRILVSDFLAAPLSRMS